MRRTVVGLLLLGALAGPWLLAGGAVVDAQTGSRARPPRTDKAEPGAGRDRKSQPVTIDADQMESLKKEGLVIFSGNVIAKQNNSVHYADRMEVYLNERDENVNRIISTGNVKIMTKDCRIGTARRAEYYDDEQKVLLIGNARVWQEDNVVTGERITMFLAEDRSVVQSGSQGRVHAIFHPRTDEQRKKDTLARADAKGKAAAPACR